jgi:N6-adenosine-specific RNA methylase IME4
VHSIIETYETETIKSPIEQHSKKPDIIRDKIVELCGEISRIELFARQKTQGWHVWGNEVKSEVICKNYIYLNKY